MARLRQEAGVDLSAKDAISGSLAIDQEIILKPLSAEENEAAARRVRSMVPDEDDAIMLLSALGLEGL